jgi:hypothetical protein
VYATCERKFSLCKNTFFIRDNKKDSPIILSFLRTLTNKDEKKFGFHFAFRLLICTFAKHVALRRLDITCAPTGVVHLRHSRGDER